MPSNQQLRPAGVPTGGQWAPMSHAEADIELVIPNSTALAKALRASGRTATGQVDHRTDFLGHGKRVDVLPKVPVAGSVVQVDIAGRALVANPRLELRTSAPRGEKTGWFAHYDLVVVKRTEEEVVEDALTERLNHEVFRAKNISSKQGPAPGKRVGTFYHRLETMVQVSRDADGTLYGQIQITTPGAEPTERYWPLDDETADLVRAKKQFQSQPH